MNLNPGNGGVSRLCAEPRVMLAVLQTMLAPYVNSGLLQIVTRCRPIGAETDGDRIRSVTVKEADGRKLTIHAPFVLDATECGDVLPLAGVEYVTGAESKRDTNEPTRWTARPIRAIFRHLRMCSRWIMSKAKTT